MTTTETQTGSVAERAKIKGEAGRRIVEALKRHGVTHLWGIPGLHTLAIYDTLYDDHSITPIIVRHESGASYAADGAAKASGVPSVICVVPGPGAINAAVGVANAYADSVPMIAITAEIPARLMGTHAIHDHDVAKTYQGAVKAQLRFDTADPDSITTTIDEAFRIATTGRPGPVQIVLPTDLLDLELPREEIIHQREASHMRDRDTETQRPEGAWREFEGGEERGVGEVSRLDVTVKAHLDPSINAALDQAVAVLAGARKPIIFAGVGVHNAGQHHTLKIIADLLRAPVYTSFSGRGIISEDEALAGGTVTSTGSEEIMGAADAALVIGSTLSEYSTLAWKRRFPAALVQIDIDPREIGNNYPAQVGIVADAAVALPALVERLSRATIMSTGELAAQLVGFRAEAARVSTEFMDSYTPALPLHPGWMVRQMRRVLPADSILTSDGSATESWLLEEFFTITHPRTVLISEVFQTMGYALPAALGAKIARSDVPVVAATGDGSLLMAMSELNTAAANNIKAIIVVFNDHMYNALRLRQERAYNERYIGVDLGDFDLAAAARALGLTGWTVAQPDDFPRMLARAVALTMGQETAPDYKGGAILIDVPIDSAPLPSRYVRSFKAGNH